jgi:hypothetical protein
LWASPELFARVGFIVTNMSRPAERVVALSNKPEHATNGSRKAKARPNGRGCRVGRSPPTRCDFSLALGYNLAIPAHAADAGADGQPRCEYQHGRVAPKRQLYGQPYMRTDPVTTDYIFRIRCATAHRYGGAGRTLTATALAALINLAPFVMLDDRVIDLAALERTGSGEPMPLFSSYRTCCRLNAFE